MTAVNAEGGAVSGVELKLRSTVEVPVVVSDADSKRTFLSLLERESFPRSFVDRADGASLSCSGFTIHLGMAKPLDDDGLACGPVLVHPSYDHRATFEAVRAHDGYPDPDGIAWGFMVNSAVDPSLAPAGRSYVDIVVPGVPYEFMGRWGVEGGVRGEKYGSMKEQYAEVVVDAVSRRSPNW